MKRREIAKREAIIRDYFAKHPEKIDEGLELIQKEYTIPSLGVLDLLCRNDFEGYYAIVELKKRKVTSSRLLDQLVRYTAAVKSEFNLETDDVRCFLIGTDFDHKTQVLAGHLRNVALRRVVRRGKGYVLLDVGPESIPKISLDQVLAFWRNRIMLRGWYFAFNVKEDHDRFVERAFGWLEAKSYDALIVIIEPFEGLMFPHVVAILTVAPDQYVGYSKLNGLVRLANNTAQEHGHMPEAGHADTGIIRYWYTKPFAPRILRIITLGELSGLSSEEWSDYLLRKPHSPYDGTTLRWFGDTRH